MQILKNLYQLSGDLNGLTFDVQGALWNDANSYLLATPQGHIMFDCGCGDTSDRFTATSSTGDFPLQISDSAC